MTGLGQHLRIALRNLLRAPGFTLAAALGMAVAIAASTAVFSIVHTLLLRSQGLRDIPRIVSLWQTDPARGQDHLELCLADLEDWSRQTSLFESVALASSVNLDSPLYDGDTPEQVETTTVSASFFPLLGARPVVGRLFTAQDDQPNAPLTIVLSHRLWRTRYASDPAVIGRQVRSGGSTATIVGVLDPEFDFPRDVDIFVPLQAAWPDVAKQRDLGVFRGVAKLRPGISHEGAQAQVDTAARAIAATRPGDPHAYHIRLTPILDEIYGPAKPGVWILLAAVLLVLLIACANTANLLLVRATVREREIALRVVLGAGRARLVAWLLAEPVVLAGFAAAGGILLAQGLIAGIAQLAPPEVQRMDQVTLDGPVLGFAIVISFVTVVLFGLGPALVATRHPANESLRRGGNRSTSAGRGHTSAREMLLIAEVALSIILLAGAGLLIRSFQALSSVDPGFDARGILTFRVTTNTGSQEVRRNLYSAILARVQQLAGVTTAGAILIRPLSGVIGWDTRYMASTQTEDQAKQNPNGNYEAISPGYFATMGIRLLAGRDFTNSDGPGSPGVVIVNRSTARRHWPQGEAVGQRVRLSQDRKAPWLTVVGVVGDVRYREWEATRPDFYVPYMQRAQHRTDFVVKTSGDPAQLAQAIRRTVLDIDRNQPISNVTTMERLVDRALSRSRFLMLVLMVLAVCALFLAGLGTYAVMAYSVVQRTAEFGVRMALGATPRGILSLVTGWGFSLVATGAVLGVAGGSVLTRSLASFLYGVPLWDPVAWAGAAVTLGAAAWIACVVPALRASRVDPARALSTEG